MSAITLRQLEIFAQTVECGGFRRCAEHIGISPVAVSGHIRTLEQRLGVQLFERQPRGPAILTVEGDAVYRRAVIILAGIVELEQLFGDRHPAGAARRILIAAHPFILRNAQLALDRFRDSQPLVAVEFDMTSDSPEQLEERIRQRTIDIAYYFALEDEPELSSTTVYTEPLGIYVARDHPLAKQRHLTVEALQSTPAIHLASSNYLRHLMERALAEIGVRQPTVGPCSDDYGMILSSVRRGMGYVCMFTATAEEAHGLQQLTPPAPLPTVQVKQLVRSGWRNDGIANELVQLLSAAIQQA